MIGSIVYGGKITDQWDTRMVTNSLKIFCNKNVLDDNHKFNEH